MKLEDLQVYQLAMDIGERVWEIVLEWRQRYDRQTIGQGCGLGGSKYKRRMGKVLLQGKQTVLLLQ
jgi:hypothetical protein